MNIGPARTYHAKKAFVDIVEIEFQAPGKGNRVSSPPEVSAGVPSLINPYAIVVFPSLGYNPTSNSGANSGVYNRLLDGSGNKFSPEYKESIPTISNLVNDAELARKTPYNYTDFLYCKYVGLIPNNQLITLRRYPAPTFDNLQIPGQLNSSSKNTKNLDITTLDINEQKEFFPIAQAVTWYGDETGNKLSDFMSFTTNINWKLLESEVSVAAGNEQGSEDSPAPGVAQFLGILTGQVNTPFTTANSQYDPYNGGPYSNRVYGPVNVISKTYKRDRGLDFKQSMNINFEYSLKSIGNINPKAAMLDIMSNMLALTYNNAAFWGGANRYFPQKPQYPFLGGNEGMSAWYRGEPLNFTKAVGREAFAASNTLGDILSKLTEGGDWVGTLKKLAVGAAKLGMGEMGKGKAPAIVAMKSLLTGEPIGEWHMTVGNPHNPIMKIGNLICTESKFEFNDIIGADNFPTELKVTITVEHGRPRDAGDIESMFNQGQGRIYYPPENLDVLDSSSSTHNSRNDTSWAHTLNGGMPSNYDGLQGTRGVFNYTGVGSKSFINPGRYGDGTGGYVPIKGYGVYNHMPSGTASFGIFTGSSSEYDKILNSIKGYNLTNNADILADKMFLRTGAGKVRGNNK